MKIYRRLAPKMAKDIVRALLAEKFIELEDGRRDEAELDVAGVLVNYLNTEEQISSDAREHLEKNNFGMEKYGAIKKAIAEQRKVKIGEDSLDYILDGMVAMLYQSKNISEVFAEDHDIRRKVRESMSKYAGVDEELDKEVRSRLKNLREGTSEWDVEYQKVIRQLRHAKGIA